MDITKKKKFPITLVSLPLVDEPDTVPERDFCLRRLSVNKWCVCTYLRYYHRYAAGHYFTDNSEAQEYFNSRLKEYLEYYQELVTDCNRHIARQDILIEQISNSLTPQQRNKLLPLAVKVSKLDRTTNKYRLCSMLLNRGFKSNDPNEIIEVINDIKEELNNSSISII